MEVNGGTKIRQPRNLREATKREIGNAIFSDGEGIAHSRGINKSANAPRTSFVFYPYRARILENGAFPRGSGEGKFIEQDERSGS